MVLFFINPDIPLPIETLLTVDRYQCFHGEWDVGINEGKSDYFILLLVELLHVTVKIALKSV